MDGDHLTSVNWIAGEKLEAVAVLKGQSLGDRAVVELRDIADANSLQVIHHEVELVESALDVTADCAVADVDGVVAREELEYVLGHNEGNRARPVDRDQRRRRGDEGDAVGAEGGKARIASALGLGELVTISDGKKMPSGPRLPGRMPIESRSKPGDGPDCDAPVSIRRIKRASLLVRPTASMS